MREMGGYIRKRNPDDPGRRRRRRPQGKPGVSAQLPSIGQRSLDALRSVDFNAPKQKVEQEKKDVEDKQE